MLARPRTDAFPALQQLGRLSQELTQTYLSVGTSSSPGNRGVPRSLRSTRFADQSKRLRAQFPSCRQPNKRLGDDLGARCANLDAHDHHCSCCFGVVRGKLSELWFRVLDERRAAVTRVATRGPGYVASMLPSGPNIHQMINEGAEVAVSIHIYGFDHRLCGSSIRRRRYELTSA